MKIIFAGVALLFTQHIFASGVMVRPPAIDQCVLFPDSEECESPSNDKDKDFDELEKENSEATPPQRRTKAPRRRMVNPCKVEPDSVSCANWKKMQRRRIHPCRLDPEGEKCALWKSRAKQRQVNPCKLDPQSENCEKWKKRFKRRRPVDGAQISYPCRENPKGPRCLWATALPTEEVN